MQMTAYKRRTCAFTLIELLVVIAVLGVTVALIVPALALVKSKNARIGCVSRLMNIGLGFRIHATDHQGRFPMQVATNESGVRTWNDGNPARYLAALSNELSVPVILVCPADKNRKVAASFRTVQQSNISYFVGLDSMEQRPSSLLAGDRNLTTNKHPVHPGLVELTTNVLVGWTSEIHGVQGNVALGDGSVQQFSEPRLADAVRGTGLATNRLAVP
jgi:prepilin-type N-terminal cleavage/methylation domain-containing protein